MICIVQERNAKDQRALTVIETDDQIISSILFRRRVKRKKLC